jgi:lactoylglutathione lyase
MVRKGRRSAAGPATPTRTAPIAAIGRLIQKTACHPMRVDQDATENRSEGERKSRITLGHAHTSRLLPAELTIRSSKNVLATPVRRLGHDEVMLRKIDCVMVRVADLQVAVEFYTRVCGLRQLWRDKTAAGMGMPETDAEVVLHTMDLPAAANVHYLVDDVYDAVSTCLAAGCVVLEAPFDIAIGRCAVLQDPFGNAVYVVDMSKGPRSTLPGPGRAAGNPDAV